VVTCLGKLRSGVGEGHGEPRPSRILASVASRGLANTPGVTRERRYAWRVGRLSRHCEYATAAGRLLDPTLWIFTDNCFHGPSRDPRAPAPRRHRAGGADRNLRPVARAFELRWVLWGDDRRG
jgi:hypothetical protein